MSGKILCEKLYCTILKIEIRYKIFGMKVLGYYPIFAALCESMYFSYSNYMIMSTSDQRSVVGNDNSNMGITYNVVKYII